jgi:two-component system phosphate regulon sensor histidine kinase PhoR
VKGRTLLKLLAIFLALILVTTFLVDFSVRRTFQQSLEGQIRRDLISKTRLVAAEVDSLPSTRPFQAFVRERAKSAEARITIIDKTGMVLADSEADPTTMENHAGRPEVRDALSGYVGIAQRTSATTHEQYLYSATAIKVGVVRLAYPLVEIERSISEAQRNLIVASLVVLPLVILLGAWIAHSLTNRLDRVVLFAEEIASGNFEARIPDSGNDELSQAVAALNRTAERLKKSFELEVSSRQQLETLLNSMQEAVIAIGPDRRVRWINGRMQSMIGAALKLGAPLAEMTRDPDLLNAVQVCLERAKVIRLKTRMIVPGRVFIATVAPIADGGVVAVLHEITDIERIEKTRRDFIANVSHELRTPLTSIRGYAETVLDFELDANTREFIEIIRKNAMRMVRLTEDLLVLARVESGEEVLNLEKISASRLVEDAQQNYQEIVRARGHKLTVDLTTAADVMADPDKILQVFINLLDNALKYSGDGTEIIIGGREATSGVEFFVRDHGPGISSEHLSRLFERFYRVDKARSVESGGTGLGLAIVKHIVLKHGGSVRAESELNRGSSFIFSLPKA